MGVTAAQLGVTGIVPNTTGLGKNLAQQVPNFILLETNNTLAEVLVTGYLNASARTFGLPYSNQQIALVYTTDQGSVWLQIAVTGTAPNYVYSLVGTSEVASVFVASVGSAAAPSYTFSGDTDTGMYHSAANTVAFSANGVLVGTIGTTGISAGASGSAGTLRSYPATASKGYLEFTGVANTGDTAVIVTNAAHGQASTYTIPDVGAATGGILVSTTALRTKIVAGAAAAGGAAAQSFTDAFCTSASCVIGNWNTQTNAASVLKIVPGNGSFVVTSSADAGVGTFNYIIAKA